MTTPILTVQDLVIEFNLRGRRLQAVRGASLELHRGRTLALVGESGAGKSVLSKALLGMLDANARIVAGRIMFDGIDLATYRGEKQWRQIRGRRIAMIFQDPMTALNPLRTIGAQVEETVRLHQRLSRGEARQRSLELLADVGISDAARRFRQYPHEFSGGMRQRIVIAIAIACQPQLLICDEPTTALDVTIQARILELIRQLQARYNLSVIYITHDLGVVANVADDVAVMYAGDIVEFGTAEDVFYDARHPYTWALLASLPQFSSKGKPLYTIAGTPPNLFSEIHGDAFAPRNPQALNIDFCQRPPRFQVSPSHYARSWLLDPRAPQVLPPQAVLDLRHGVLP